jgi:deazaflavin-dependent oxidoreductase (nitroreductase family)
MRKTPGAVSQFCLDKMRGEEMSKAPQAPVKTLTNRTVLKLVSKFNVVVYRLSGGRIMGKIRGTPVCLLTMTGRKSGRRITTALMCTALGDDIILVASLGGGPKNPIWYNNVMADPHIEIQTGWKRRRMLARQASPEVKKVLWPSVVANFPSYADYQQNTTRDIPVIICTPEGK